MQSNVETQLCLELLNNKNVPMLPDEGIITYADKDTFIGFQLLTVSLALRHSTFNLMVIDMGMTEVQRTWCVSNDIPRVRPDHRSLYRFDYKGVRWNKPNYLKYSPYDYTLLIDPQVMVTRSLCNMFEFLRVEPVFVPNPNTEQAFDFALYNNYLPLREYSNVRVYPLPEIVGFSYLRDFHIIRDWMWATYNAETYSKVREAVENYEQGTLGWSLVRHELMKKIMIRDYPYTVRALDNHYESPEKLIRRISYDAGEADAVIFKRPFWQSWEDKELIYVRLDMLNAKSFFETADPLAVEASMGSSVVPLDLLD